MSTEAVKAEAKKPVPMWANVASWLIVGVPVLWLLSTCAGKSSQPDVFDHIDALVMCQNALKSAARDPENAEVPYVENFGRGDEYVYSWGAQTKMARMRNGLGLEVAASASCVVDGRSQRITSLTLNGQTLI